MYTVRARVDAGDGWTDLGDGVTVPSRMTIEVTGDYEVTLQVVVRDGRFVCETIRADEITGELLRLLPIRELIRSGVIDATAISASPSSDLSLSAADLAKDGPTDDALRAAAAVYRLAHAVGDPPTKNVALSLHIGYSTASRWLRLARDKGILGETRQGKAGV